MSFSDLIHRELRSASYWTQLALLELFGPATQDRQSDPVEQLKRRYGRPPSP